LLVATSRDGQLKPRKRPERIMGYDGGEPSGIKTLANGFYGVTQVTGHRQQAQTRDKRKVQEHFG